MTGKSTPRGAFFSPVTFECVDCGAHGFDSCCSRRCRFTLTGRHPLHCRGYASITIPVTFGPGRRSRGFTRAVKPMPSATAVERVSMKFFVWLIRVLVFVLLLVLALANTQ